MDTPAELGTHVGLKLKKKRKACYKPMAFEADLGTIVGRALVRLSAQTGRVIELKRGDDPNDWTDPKKVYGSLDAGSRSGLGGRLISNAELGGRLSRDIYRVATGDHGGGNSASTDNFKLTQNSRNTARVTVGPDRRTRRPKYEWERAETRRKIHKALLTAAVVGGGLAGAKLYQKGEGSILKGIQVTGKEAAAKTADVGRGIAAVVTGRPYIPKKMSGSSSVEKEIAKKIAEKRAMREASKHAPTSQADGVNHGSNEIPFRK